jgi:hypothetical protein
MDETPEFVAVSSRIYETTLDYILLFSTIPNPKMKMPLKKPEFMKNS